MDIWSSLKSFVAVAEQGGFAKAARAAGLATSSITRQIDSLEDYLSVQLLNRSTRRVTLTPAGEEYYEHALRILEDIEEANRSVSEAGGDPRGILRVSLPVAFGRLHIAPLLPGYSRAYPEVQLDVTLTDSIVDLVENRIDVAVRLGALSSSSLIARKLGPHKRIVCASPDYLGEHGHPNVPDDLERHNCLLFNYTDGDQTWSFAKGTEKKSINVKGNLKANNSELLREAAIGGAGFIMMPTWLVGEDIRAGRLECVLLDWSARHGEQEGAIHAVYLPNRKGSNKVRSFIDYLIKNFGTPPYWEDGVPDLQG